jgi:hypothetical protein
LLVDVRRKIFEIKDRDSEYCRKHIGGALLAAAPFEELTTEPGPMDAFSPENPVIAETVLWHVKSNPIPIRNIRRWPGMKSRPFLGPISG